LIFNGGKMRRSKEEHKKKCKEYYTLNKERMIKNGKEYS